MVRPKKSIHVDTRILAIQTQTEEQSIVDKLYMLF
ncbi:hypothetical protein ABH968_000042 [Lysinibacillus sp. RC79]